MYMSVQTHATFRMTSLTVALALVLAATTTGSALAQGTAFTYQGQLKDAGAAAAGDYDMTFRLFDADSGGNQVGTDIDMPALAVSEGLFTVLLDFGVDAYTDNQPRWLEITVNGEPLSPLQPLTPAPFSINTRGIHVAADGKVGIGTDAPAQALSVAGAIESTTNGFRFPDGTVQATASTGGGGFWSSSGTNIFNNNSGTVGVGTATPNAKLHVSGGPFWTSNFWTKSLALNSAEAIELGYGASSTRFGIGSSQNGLYFFRTTTEDTAAPANYFMSADSAGRIAMGDLVGSLTAKLTLFASGNGAELLRFNTERPWAFKQAYTGSGTALRLQPDTGLKNFEIAAAGGTIVATFEGNDAAPRLVVNGTTATKVLQITGADLAEKFPTSDGKVQPGMVMEIDPENPGHLRTSDSAYNQRVAGVVSGANDFPAGAILGHLPGNEDAPPVALSGRVWTWCDASEGAISPGDLLTTSATPGHAMKAVDRDRSHGAVIGKAMTALEQGEVGLVLVLVNLQ
jgi:hypothetical protein